VAVEQSESYDELIRSVRPKSVKELNDIAIQTATVEDIPQLVELLGTLFEQEPEFHPIAERQRCALEQLLSMPNKGQVLVVKRRTRCVAMVSLLETISTAEGGLAVLLEDFVVATDCRGQGIGRRLMNFALEECRSRGITRVTLLTDRDNSKAQRFYVEAGFYASKMVPFRVYLR
jgi:ribosomal protein S18 acetylase RimI-like enzyme